MTSDAASDLAMFTALVSFLNPLLVSVIQQPTFSKRTRTLVAALVALVVGGLTVYFNDPDLFTDGSALTTVILTVLVGSAASYRTFWKPLGIEKVETATSRPSAITLD